MAGIWSGWTNRNGAINGKYSPIYEYMNEFTDDDTTPSIPNVSLSDVTGFLVAARIKFDGTTPPDTLTVTITDYHGSVLASGTITASGGLTIDSPIPFVEGLTIACSGNTTVSAKAKIVLLVM